MVDFVEHGAPGFSGMGVRGSGVGRGWLRMGTGLGVWGFRLR